MNYKILIGILIIFLLASSVNAKDISDLTDDDLNNVNFSDRDTVVEFDGFNFTIPSGFGPLEDFDVNDTSDGVSSHSTFFVNENDEVIMISTIVGDDITLNLDDYNTHSDSDKKTINGHEGWQFEDGGYEFFNYIYGDVVIILQAPDEDYFEVMIN